MDWKTAKQLVEKYWQGETSWEEEQMIHEYFSESADYESNDDYQYFQAIKSFQNQSLDATFEDRVIKAIQQRPSGKTFGIRKYLAVAASIVVALGIGLSVFIQHEAREKKRKAEIAEAFEVTKNALLLISTELNKGAAVAQELDAFDSVYEKIKSENLN